MAKPPQSGRPGTMDREPTLYWGSSKVRTGLIRLDSFGRQQRPVGLHLIGDPISARKVRSIHESHVLQ